MSEISKNILKTIDEKHIKPIPKWQFILLHVGLFVMFGFTILFGSMATGIALLHLATTDWEIVPRLGGGMHSFIYVLPYMWILVLGLMIFLATLVYKHTNQGYKIKPSLVVAISIIASLIIGSVLFATNSAEGIEMTLREKVRPYAEYQEMRNKVWQAPDQGILPGTIVDIQGDSLMLLDDFSEKRWTINIENVLLPPLAPKPQIGDQVMVIGEKTGKDTFTAEGIRPAPHMLKKFQPGQKKMK